MRRTLLTLALLAAAAAPLSAQRLPAGWAGRVDRANMTLDSVRFAAMGEGYHVTSGPAGIYWRPEDGATGEYRVHATFTQTKAPRHPEAYGLILGGKDLDAAGADYMYFLVRGDGKYTIKHRAANGDIHTIVDWTEHEAVNKQDAAGKATDALEVIVEDDGLALNVNGREVHELPRVPYMNTDGLYGLRVNHHLDVHVDGFGKSRR